MFIILFKNLKTGGIQASVFFNKNNQVSKSFIIEHFEIFCKCFLTLQSLLET